MAYKKPPPHPFKKGPLLQKTFFSIFALSLNFLAIYFFLLANRDFQMFPAKTFFISTFFWSFAILLFLLPFNLGVGRSWRVKREGSVATGGIIISPKPQHYFLKNINTISSRTSTVFDRKTFANLSTSKGLSWTFCLFFSVRIERLFHCKTSTVVQNSILYNFFSLRNSSEENLLRENGKSWNCLSSHPQTFQHKNFSDVTDTVNSWC